MNWTTEFPTEEGWYWLLRDNEGTIILETYRDKGELCCWNINNEGYETQTLREYQKTHLVTYWAGPIPEPE